MNIGDKIIDIEDGDCYYEGIVVELNPMKYKVTNIVWCDEIDDSMNGQVIKQKWWYIENEDGEMINIWENDY